MRLKTNKESAIILDELKSHNIFETKAEVIKLAINLAISSKIEKIDEFKEDGFEISTDIIFGSEKEYYEEIIKVYYKTSEISKYHYLNLINNGILILNQLMRKAKYGIEDFTTNLLKEVREK